MSAELQLKKAKSGGLFHSLKHQVVRILLALLFSEENGLLFRELACLLSALGVCRNRPSACEVYSPRTSTFLMSPLRTHKGGMACCLRAWDYIDKWWHQSI